MSQSENPPTENQAAGPGAERWERRGAPRQSPSESKLWVGWPKDSTFFVTGAGLINISRTGALLVLETSPQKDQAVWLRLEGPAPIEDVQGIVVETIEISEHEHEVRIAFREPYPQEFYLAAVNGLPAILSPRVRPAPSH